MSIGGPGYSPLTGFTGLAPDTDKEIVCWGATRMQMQVTNQAVLITFGQGPRGAVFYELVPEQYAPVIGLVVRAFDAFKIRAAVPAAQLPSGASPAFVVLTPRQ